jgi:hypothetical protein
MAAMAPPVFHFELRRLLNEVQEDATVLEQPALGYFKVSATRTTIQSVRAHAPVCLRPMCLALNPLNRPPPSHVCGVCRLPLVQEFLTEWVAKQHDAGADSSTPTHEVPAVAPRSPRRRGPVAANPTKTMAAEAAAAAEEEHPQASAAEPERVSNSAPQVSTASHDEPARRADVGEGDDCLTPDPDPVREFESPLDRRRPLRTGSRLLSLERNGSGDARRLKSDMGGGVSVVRNPRLFQVAAEG